jgi:hypothetical protein
VGAAGAEAGTELEREGETDTYTVLMSVRGGARLHFGGARR